MTNKIMLTEEEWAATATQAMNILDQLGWKEIRPLYLKKWGIWKVFQSPGGCPHCCNGVRELAELAAFAVEYQEFYDAMHA